MLAGTARCQCVLWAAVTCSGPSAWQTTNALVAAWLVAAWRLFQFGMGDVRLVQPLSRWHHMKYVVPLSPLLIHGGTSSEPAGVVYCSIWALLCKKTNLQLSYRVRAAAHALLACGAWSVTCLSMQSPYWLVGLCEWA